MDELRAQVELALDIAADADIPNDTRTLAHIIGWQVGQIADLRQRIADVETRLAAAGRAPYRVQLDGESVSYSYTPGGQQHDRA